MKIIPLYNQKWLTWFDKEVVAQTIYPFIFYVESEEEVWSDNNVVVEHETVHVRQVRQLGWLYFYVSYYLYFLWFYLKLRNHDAAYEAIPYEVEAYALEDGLVLTADELSEYGYEYDA